MPQILYTVRTTCPSVQVRGRYLAWLSPNHIVEVMKGGATGARIVLPLPDDRSGLSAVALAKVEQTPAGQEAGTARPSHDDHAPAVSPEPAERAVVEVQYVFPSRKAFDTYLRDHAPALRADGLKHFPPESGVTSTRQVAEIAAEL
jgi:hypothetical protein